VEVSAAPSSVTSYSTSTIAHGIENGSNLALEVRELILHDVPDDPHVDTEVVMDENVAETGDLAPFDMRLLLRYLLR
jgi:hypothetical protein